MVANAKPVISRPVLLRCSTCDRPLLGATPDPQGRCSTCSERNARTVDCCGFLYEGETCSCAADALIERCIDCAEPTHASESNDLDLCARCADRRDDRWVGRVTECSARELHARLTAEMAAAAARGDADAYHTALAKLPRGPFPKGYDADEDLYIYEVA